MGLVHIWYDSKYCSEIFISTIPIFAHDLKLKVIELEILC